MNKLFFAFALTLITFGLQAQSSAAGEGVTYNPNGLKDSSKKSLNAMAITVIKGDSVQIAYHSPGVRNRVIWGGLVPYDEVWVTGAHSATTLQIDKPFMIGEKEIAAGKYAFFTIPGKKTWTIIINKNFEQHLASDYDQTDDIVRLQVQPLKNAHTERLQYEIESNKKGNHITVAWEKLKIQVPFTIL